MNVLVLCDDFWHPGEVIVRGLKFLEEKGYNLDIVMACKDILTAKMIRRYDVIINARGDCHSPGNHEAVWFEEGVTAVMPREFKAYVEEGHGFIALHSGNTYKNTKTPEMVDLIGNEFVNHPPQCTITAKAVKEHPIMKDVKPFTFRDEHYIINITAEDADIFMEGTSETRAGTQPAGYTRNVGKGRLVVLTPGHNSAVFEDEEYQKVLINALEWSVGNI